MCRKDVQYEHQSHSSSSWVQVYSIEARLVHTLFIHMETSTANEVTFFPHRGLFMSPQVAPKTQIGVSELLVKIIQIVLMNRICTTVQFNAL